MCPWDIGHIEQNFGVAPIRRERTPALQVAPSQTGQPIQEDAAAAIEGFGFSVAEPRGPQDSWRAIAAQPGGEKNDAALVTYADAAHHSAPPIRDGRSRIT